VSLNVVLGVLGGIFDERFLNKKDVEKNKKTLQNTK